MLCGPQSPRVCYRGMILILPSSPLLLYKPEESSLWTYINRRYIIVICAAKKNGGEMVRKESAGEKKEVSYLKFA